MKFWVPAGEPHPADVLESLEDFCPPDVDPADCMLGSCRTGPPDGPHDTLPPCTYRKVVELMFDANKGMLGQWACKNLSLYQILDMWKKNVRADDGTPEGAKFGKAILMNWDARCPSPRLLMWADPYPTCAPADINGRCIGTYIVNGGACLDVE